jgi:hypothetical protein
LQDPPPEHFSMLGDYAEALRTSRISGRFSIFFL